MARHALSPKASGAPRVKLLLARRRIFEIAGAVGTVRVDPVEGIPFGKWTKLFVKLACADQWTFKVERYATVMTAIVRFGFAATRLCASKPGSDALDCGAIDRVLIGGLVAFASNVFVKGAIRSMRRTMRKRLPAMVSP